jgi:acyl-CoA synthetase (NDP forming)
MQTADLPDKTGATQNRASIPYQHCQEGRHAMIKNQNALTEVESKDLLRKAGIPVVETKLAHSKKEAIAIGKQMGFPVVLKINSPDVMHKSDAGGVRLGLSNATQVGRAYSEIMSVHQTGISGSQHRRSISAAHGPPRR